MGTHADMVKDDSYFEVITDYIKKEFPKKSFGGNIVGVHFVSCLKGSFSFFSIFLFFFFFW